MHGYKKFVEPHHSFIKQKTGLNVLSFALYIIYFLSCLFIFTACNTKEGDLSKITPYNEPLMETYNIERLYSDKAVIRVRMTAPKEEQMESEDMFYPKGVYIEFYDEKQTRTSTLRANAGKYSKAKQLYTVTGNVVIIDSVKAQKMNTEELNWDPNKQKIFTDKFVTIQTKNEVIKGQGLEAKQDFSNWRILNPSGRLPINKE